MADLSFYINAAPGLGRAFAPNPGPVLRPEFASKPVAQSTRADRPIRAGLVAAVRDLIAAGLYDESGKLDKTADGLARALDLVA